MPDQFWAVCCTQGQREQFAAGHLEARGYEVFLPRVETRRSIEPVFRGYLFLRIIDRWRSAETAFGVIALIKAGDAPARCPDREIEALKARADETGLIRLPPPPPAHVYKRGERVRVNVAGCAFDGLHSGVSLRGRERILLQVLGSVRPIMVASHLVVQAG
jgi:hypothetical protein